MARTVDSVDREVLEAGGILLSQDGAVLTVELNRPESRNPQTPAMWEALQAIGDAVAGDSDLAAVIVSGRGPSFSAGLDRRMFTPEGIPGQPSLASIAGESDSVLDGFIRQAQAAFTWWREVEPVTIAAVAGHAVGAGFQLALACDMIVASHDAQFAMRETSYGLVPDLAGTWPLVHVLGYGRALELCMTGRAMSAQEAWQAGLVSRLSDSPQQEAVGLAEGIAQTPTGAVAELMALLRDAPSRSPREQQEAERRAQARRLRSLLRGDN